VAFQLPADRYTQSRALDAAIARKEAQEENIPSSLGYESSSPVKGASERYRGGVTGGNLGAYGAFGGQINDVSNQPAQRFAGDFMDRYLNGIFSPSPEIA